MDLNTLSITIPVPCVQGKFGKRLATYSTQIPALQVRRVLGHDPRSRNWKTLPKETLDIYQRVQRPTSANRRDGVMDYIEQRLGPRQQVAAFPAISIGVTEHCHFEEASPKAAIGTLHLEEEGFRIVLDGLGRLSGCLDLADESDEGKELVKQIMLPVTFYLPAPGTDALTIEELGQLFMDFNFRVHPVPARIAIALDSSDIYITLVNRLAKEPFINDYGGMERKASSLGKNAMALVVQSVLLRVVRGACEGRDFQESNLSAVETPNLTDKTFNAELNSIAQFFLEISQRMGTTRWTDRTSLHLTSPGWQALGVIHHDMNHRGLALSPSDKMHVYNVIADIDWSRSNKAVWVDEAKLGVWGTPKNAMTEQVIILGAGRNNTQAIIDFLRDRTGLQPKLDAVDEQNKADRKAEREHAAV